MYVRPATRDVHGHGHPGRTLSYSKSTLTCSKTSTILHKAFKICNICNIFNIFNVLVTCVVAWRAWRRPCRSPRYDIDFAIDIFGVHPVDDTPCHDGTHPPHHAMPHLPHSRKVSTTMPLIVTTTRRRLVQSPALSRTAPLDPIPRGRLPFPTRHSHLALVSSQMGLSV